MPAPDRATLSNRQPRAPASARADAPARRGVSEAEFEAFARENLDRAVRFAWRLVGGDHGAAEDVTQDALLAAHRALGRFRGDAKLDTWFFRILYRKALNHRRWRALRLPFDGDAANDVPDPRRLDRAADAEAARRIDAALARLTAPQRGAFVLVHLEGFTTVEAAALMGKAHGTVKSHLQRALRALREQLEDLRPGAAARGAPDEESS